MTVSELYGAVAQLGFEDTLEYADAFFHAANRALLQINAIRPAIGHCTIRHRAPENQILGATLDPLEKVDELTFEASDVKSYYFEADGDGMLYLERFDEGAGVWSIIGAIPFSGGPGFVPHRGFIKHDGAFLRGLVRMRFVGEYVYSVRGVAMYTHLYGASEADIPAFEAYTRYDISQMVSDFLTLSSPPIEETDELRRIHSGYDVEDDRVILLSREVPGTYKVLYRRRPAALVDLGNAEEDETVIDLCEELAALMPNLVGAYVWMDDEPEKAQYYMMLYREQAAELERRARTVAPVAFRDVYGW